MQGLLFDDEAERRKTEAEIEWTLRRLAQAYRDCSLEDPEKLETINQEINRVTRGLAVHPYWWAIPACECDECREREKYFAES